MDITHIPLITIILKKRVSKEKGRGEEETEGEGKGRREGEEGHIGRDRRSEREREREREREKKESKKEGKSGSEKVEKGDSKNTVANKPTNNYVLTFFMMKLILYKKLSAG